MKNSVESIITLVLGNESLKQIGMLLLTNSLLGHIGRNRKRWCKKVIQVFQIREICAGDIAYLWAKS